MKQAKILLNIKNFPKNGDIMRKTLLGAFFVLLNIHTIKCQDEFGPINSGVANFLMFPTDARSVAMGGTGVALTGNSDAIFYNASTVLVSDKSAGINYTFSPRMREIESGYYFNSVGGFYKINKRNAILAGFRHYKYPQIDISENGKTAISSISPAEWVIDVGYAYQIIPNLSAALVTKFIHSDMGTPGDAKAANTFACDFGVTYKKDISGMDGAYWVAGFNLSNIGSGLKYLKQTDPLPAYGKIGGSVNLPFSTTHRFIVTADLGYRFAPTDVRSLNISTGAEYTYVEHFSIRGGYHYGNRNKGDESYATAGAGMNYYGFNIGFSWLFANKDCALRNTYALSLGYSF